MTFVLHSARVAPLIVLCLLLASEDGTVYYWDGRKDQSVLGDLLTLQGEYCMQGTELGSFILADLFLWPLVASVPHFLSGLSLLSLWIL